MLLCQMYIDENICFLTSENSYSRPNFSSFNVSQTLTGVRITISNKLQEDAGAAAT